MDISIIILGATGDLAKRKLIPAVFAFFKNNKNIKNFSLICAAIEQVEVTEILEASKGFVSNFDAQIWDDFCKCVYYKKVDFVKLSDFKKLAQFSDEVEAGYNNANRLVYAASMPDHFCAITKNSAKSGLVKNSKDIEFDQVGRNESEQENTEGLKSSFWHRIVYEKPFGHDLNSAKKINRCIAKYFCEDQIYRVDHYLTKEIVSNIATLRFANCVFEPLWNNKFIEQVDVILDEKLGLEGRGRYYDKYGAIRDVVQNHILEIISLIAMDSPVKLTGDFIRDQRLKVLKKINFVDGYIGQYEGYTKEPFVKEDSKTETFAQLDFEIKNKKWAGVKFYTRTGKCLDKKLTEIIIKFRQCNCILLRSCPMMPNYLTINIYPKGTFSLSLNVKNPVQVGQVIKENNFQELQKGNQGNQGNRFGDSEIVPVNMEFCHFCEFGKFIAESYEVILDEVIAGNTAVSVRFDEIEALWKITDKIYERDLKLVKYVKGSEPKGI